MKPDSVLTVVCSFEGDGVEEGSIPNPASIRALSCLLSTCITDRWRSRKLAITSLVQTGHLCWDGRGQPTHSVSQADFFLLFKNSILLLSISLLQISFLPSQVLFSAELKPCDWLLFGTCLLFGSCHFHKYEPCVLFGSIVFYNEP